MNKRPTRKKNRLPDYNYSTSGAYFVTLCIANREAILWDLAAISHKEHHPVLFDGERIEIPLSSVGQIVNEAVLEIEKRYSTITVDNYSIMPDHIHMIITIKERQLPQPTLSRVIQQFKGAVTKQIGKSIWQKSFIDHVFRNENEYYRTWRYVDNNPILFLDKMKNQI